MMMIKSELEHGVEFPEMSKTLKNVKCEEGMSILVVLDQRRVEECFNIGNGSYLK